MSLKTRVKVGKITNLSDARYCAGMNVDMLGFVTVESQENYLPVKDFQDIRGWVSGPKVVAEVYGLQSSEQLDRIIENYRPDYLELSLQELELVQSKLPILLRIDSQETFLPKKGLEPFAIITKNLDRKLFINEGKSLHFIDLSDCLNQEIPKDESFDGIVLSGSKEESPGLKDYDQLADVLESLEVD